MRATANREILVRATVEDNGGRLTDADAGVSFTVDDGDGDEVVPSTSMATSVSPGVYEVIIDPLPLDVYTVNLTATVDGHARAWSEPLDVVARRLTPLHHYRSRIDEERSEAGLAALDDAALRTVAEVTEDWFVDALHYSPFVRPLRATFTHRGGPTIEVPEAPYPRALYALSINGTAQDLADYEVVDGSIRNVRGWTIAAGARVTVFLDHGRWTRTPADLQRAAVMFGEYVAAESDLPARASEVQTEGAIISLALPSPGRPTGIPEVDGVVIRYGLPAIV